MIIEPKAGAEFVDANVIWDLKFIPVLILSATHGTGKTKAIINNFERNRRSAIISQSYEHLETINKMMGGNYFIYKSLENACPVAKASLERVKKMRGLAFTANEIHTLIHSDSTCPFVLEKEMLKNNPSKVLTTIDMEIANPLLRRDYTYVDEINGLFEEQTIINNFDYVKTWSEEGLLINEGVYYIPNPQKKVEIDTLIYVNQEEIKRLKNDITDIDNVAENIQYTISTLRTQLTLLQTPFRFTLETIETRLGEKAGTMQVQVAHLMPRIYNLLKRFFERDYFGITSYHLVIASADFMIFKEYVKEIERYLGMLIDTHVIPQSRDHFLSAENELPVLEGPKKSIEIRTLGYMENRSYSMRKWRSLTAQDIRTISKIAKGLETAAQISDKKVVIVVPTQKAEEKIRNYRDDNKWLFPKSKYDLYHYGNQLNGRNFHEDENIGLLICFGDYIPNSGDLYKDDTTAYLSGFGIKSKVSREKRKEIWSYELMNTIQGVKRGRGVIPTFYIGNLLDSEFIDDRIVKNEIFEENNLKLIKVSIIYIGTNWLFSKRE